MRFQVADQIWQVVETTADGDIAVLVVEGKPTKRRGFFPHSQSMQSVLPSPVQRVQREHIPF